MTTEECEQLCIDAGLNVRVVTRTARHFIAQVGKDRRSSSTILTQLKAIAKQRDLPVKGIIFHANPMIAGDDEYWVRVQ